MTMNYNPSMMMMSNQTNGFSQNNPNNGVGGGGGGFNNNDQLSGSNHGGNNNADGTNDQSNNPNSVSAFLRAGGGPGGFVGGNNNNNGNGGNNTSNNPSSAANGMQMGNMNSMNGNPAGGFNPNNNNNNGNSNMGGMMNAMNNPAAAQQMNAMNMNAMNMNAMNMNNFNLNELKRLQQLQQLQQASNMVPTSAHPQQDPSAAILQSYLDQKIQSSRFGDLGSTMGGLQGAAAGLQGQNPMLGGANLFMMNQNNLGGMNVGPMGGGAAGGANDMPLPSPHSLFHRDGSRRMRGGVIEPFPEKLHRLLLEVEAAGRGDVISFVANGRAFAIHKPEKFFKEIVPLYFRQSRLSSFKRQLNLYGFELINTGPARGGYYHELFVKDRPELCRRMRRVAVKVTPRPADPSDVSKDKNQSSADTTKKTAAGEPPIKPVVDDQPAEAGNLSSIKPELSA